MIVDGFPESHPQVQNTQPAGHAAHEAAGDEVAQTGRAQQERIIGPLGRPGQNDQQHAKRGTHGHEQQSANAQKPYFGIACPAVCSALPTPINRITSNRGSLSRCRSGRNGRLSGQSILPPRAAVKMNFGSDPSGYFTA
jgi:hypothetical protein